MIDETNNNPSFFFWNSDFIEFQFSSPLFEATSLIENIIERNQEQRTITDLSYNTEEKENYDFSLPINGCENTEGNQSHSQDKIPKRRKPFMIITERKMKPDAIVKRINCLFFNWLIRKVNSIAKGVKFNKLSKKTVKAIKKKEVLEIISKSLKDLLRDDIGSEKYRIQFVNKESIDKIYNSDASIHKELRSYLNKPVSSFYKEFIKTDISVNGPSIYKKYFDEFKKKYLDLFTDEEN